MVAVLLLIILISSGLSRLLIMPMIAIVLKVRVLYTAAWFGETCIDSGPEDFEDVCVSCADIALSRVTFTETVDGVVDESAYA
jgi:hypothetical protein